MAYRFEFDPVNKILRGNFDGRVTDESLAEFYRAAQAHWAATDASAAISDYTFATEWAVSHEFIRALANEEPAVADPAKRPRVVVAPTAVGFGISRMFQIVGESKRPRFKVVRTMDEAFAELGVKAPHFEPLK
ncbi:MAG: hypothetical protein ABSA27_09815 [Terriglobales bacterium]|jgi:hypothetical protein